MRQQVFEIRYPEQTGFTIPSTKASALACTSTTGFTIQPELFATLHPFHLLLDKDCFIMQHGHVLKRLLPDIAPGTHISQFFTVRSSCLGRCRPCIMAMFGICAA